MDLCKRCLLTAPENTFHVLFCALRQPVVLFGNPGTNKYLQEDPKFRIPSPPLPSPEISGEATSSGPKASNSVWRVVCLTANTWVLAKIGVPLLHPKSNRIPLKGPPKRVPLFARTSAWGSSEVGSPLVAHIVLEYWMLMHCSRVLQISKVSQSTTATAMLHDFCGHLEMHQGYILHPQRGQTLSFERRKANC